MNKRQGSAKERSVFVGNIPYDVTEEQLKEIFSGAGTVVNFRLVTDRETGKPKGYGFCEYADGATAMSAMRNLNGFEVNGRNLRVDFADGGDNKSSSNGGGGGGGGGSHFGDHKPTAAVSGEAVIKAIEGAISRFGPLKLFDMLVELKEHARQQPDHTKAMLAANPALTHAIIQSFKTLQIPIPPPSAMPPALLAGPPPPPPHLHGPPPPPLYGRGMGPPPPQQRLQPPTGPPGGGILGMAPPQQHAAMNQHAPPQHVTMGQHAPPLMGAAPVQKPGGSTRWSSRPPGPPPAGLMPPPMTAAGPPPMQQQQQQQQQAPPPLHAGPPPYQGPPPHRMTMPQQQQHQQQQPQQPPVAQQQSPLLQQPPPVLQVNRDPRRARDPRLAKRPLVQEPAATDLKRSRPEDQPPHYQQQQQQPQQQTNGTMDAIAELAREMTPQKLNLLPPNERQMLMMYMQQHGMPFGS